MNAVKSSRTASVRALVEEFVADVNAQVMFENGLIHFSFGGTSNTTSNAICGLIPLAVVKYRRIETI